MNILADLDKRQTPQRPASRPTNDHPDALSARLLSAADGAMVLDDDGRITLWNPAAERLLGHSADEAVGHLCCDVLTGRAGGEPPCAHDCHLRRAAASGQPIESFDVETRTKLGAPVRLSVSTLAVRDEAGAGVTIHLFRTVAPSDRPSVLPEPNLEACIAAAQQASTLTRRERQILKMLVGGANTRVVAAQLGVSTSTVRNHVQNLFAKLGVHSRLQAVAFATSHRLL